MGSESVALVGCAKADEAYLHADCSPVQAQACISAASELPAQDHKIILHRVREAYLPSTGPQLYAMPA